MADQLTPTDILNYHHRILKKREYNRNYYQTRIKPIRDKKKLAPSQPPPLSVSPSHTPSPEVVVPSPPLLTPKEVSPPPLFSPSPSPNNFLQLENTQLRNQIHHLQSENNLLHETILNSPPNNVLQLENTQLRNQIHHLQSENNLLHQTILNSSPNNVLQLQSENDLLHETIDQLRNKYSELLMQYSHKILPKLGNS